MKKIGVLLESLQCSTYLYDTIKSLHDDKNIDLYFILNKKDKNIKNKPQKDLKSLIEHKIFRAIIKIEYLLFSKKSSLIKDHYKALSVEDLKENDEIYITPTFSKSGLFVEYAEDDIERLKSLGLDIILRGNAPGIFRGGVLNAAKDGVISFHHGDNRWNRGGPPAFWEVFLRKDKSGFIIQTLTEQLDGGRVVMRGDFPTKRTFLHNQVSLYNNSNPYMAKVLTDYAKTGLLPAEEEIAPFSHSIYKTPKWNQSLCYLAKTFHQLLQDNINKRLLKKSTRWGVMYQKSDIKNLNMSKGTQIKNPKGHFYADPFLAERENRNIIFIEDFDYAKGRGHISAIEIKDNSNYEILGPVIEENFHMSFPFLFEFENELYMVPETAGSNTVRLYKCIDFPMKWEYQKDLLKNVKAADTMILPHGDKWWMFTNLNLTDSLQNDSCSTLWIYYSDSPLSDVWHSHKSNPVTFDCSIARNAGFAVENGKLIRGRQYQGFDNYGQSLSLAEITSLTESEFIEKTLCRIQPEFLPDLIGCHHLHADNGYVVYDYAKRERIDH